MSMKKLIAVMVALVLAIAPTTSAYDNPLHCLSSVNTADSAHAAALEFLVCSYCGSDVTRFRLFNTNQSQDIAVCKSPEPSVDPVPHIAASILNYARVQGYFWADPQVASRALEHLLRYMPIRDSVKLMQSDDRFLDFLLENIRFSILVRRSGPGWASNTSLISDNDWLEYVLPYAFLDEKRDINFGWRRRFYQLFASNVSRLKTSTEAMHFLASEIPKSQAAGVLSLNGNMVPGHTVNWESETSPMRLSPDQVINLGGASCTGTAILMAAAARAVGIAVRIAGCSQSVPNDDHHWVEFLDRDVKQSPLGDYWHTKEGTSKGNEGGPWDAPSEPMNTCFKYVVPKDPKRLNSMWASKWSSPEDLPLQWGPEGILGSRMSFVGGMNRCGAYCMAYGCGMNQTNHWSQADCGVP